MATTQLTLGYPSGTNIFSETDIENTAVTVKASGGTIYMIDLDNTANGAASYLKLYFTGGSVTVGTTVPDEIIHVPASKRITIAYPDANKAFTGGLQAACVTAGGTAGNTSPTSSVILKVVYA